LSQQTVMLHLFFPFVLNGSPIITAAPHDKNAT
jgi:hypothetical protein